ncbi:hypothetical protein S7711_07117 [Stachybotrys chartarum IBT 7711]|uniref:Subtilisin-like serine protease n=1 Tax=Stachybotrys chartarum (strain CBS 109288 / IBT 7711) TaxID=1280523 RepID=A0A084B342_STACB|nr:hypothetical protein S7711_07117 [Stachybotrys chartarum IBT 7711]KFA50634.1 hypothetical protein S40293_04893 [Stachybotrys chartarum IBT 40293]
MGSPSGIPKPSASAPFPHSIRLCDALTSSTDTQGRHTLLSRNPSEKWLPGFPRVPLAHASGIVACLGRELTTPKLDAMLPYLWLVATPRSTHVSSLTNQLVRGREIVVTEDPELHIVWLHSRIFIKPIPPFLFSHALWEVYLGPASSPSFHSSETDKLRRAALGYMRSYYHLIQHESDYRLAQEVRLIPLEIGFPQFMAFIDHFGSIPDSAVSPRYIYGQLRLTRLNTWALPALGKWQFQKVHWQYADIFAQFYAPILLAFAFLSVVLTAMQVAAQVRPAWEEFASVAAWFSVLCLLSVGLTGVAMLMLLLTLMMKELTFAVRAKKAMVN